MEMEQPAAPESEVIEPTAVETELAIESDDPELGENTAEPTETEEEVEYEGEKFKVPPKLKDALLRQADYTRKTQEVAEARRNLEAERAAVMQSAQAQQQNIREVAKLVSMDERLGQLSQVNWQALNQSDPLTAQALHIEFTQLQSQRGQLVNSLTQRQQQELWNQQHSRAKQFQEAEAYVKREMKDWSPEKDVALERYAKDEGVDLNALRSLAIANPAILKVIDKASKFDTLLKKQSTRPRPDAQEAPVTRISAAKAGTVKDPDNMSIAEWTKWRDAQTRRRR